MKVFLVAGLIAVLSGCSIIPTQSSFETVGGNAEGLNIGEIVDQQSIAMYRQIDPTRTREAQFLVADDGCHSASLFEEKGTHWTLDRVRAEAVHVIGDLSNDAVVNEVINAAIRTGVLAKFHFDVSKCAAVAPRLLKYDDFVRFANVIGGLETEDASSGLRPAQFMKAATPKLSPYLVAYIAQWYHGKFVDRFEKTLATPDFKKGIDDAAISGFARVILEAIFDAALDSHGLANVYVDKFPSPTKYFPANTGDMPTALTLYNGAPLVQPEPVVAAGSKGVTAAEAKFTEFAANSSAAEAVTLSSGFLKFLKNIHVGFIVTGSFAVGDNDTVVDLATVFFETVARRSVEATSYAIFENVDGDAIPLIVLVGSLN